MTPSRSCRPPRRTGPSPTRSAGSSTSGAWRATARCAVIGAVRRLVQVVRQEGEEPGTATAFAAMLQNKGFENYTLSGRRRWRSLGLQEEDPR